MTTSHSNPDGIVRKHEQNRRRLGSVFLFSPGDQLQIADILLDGRDAGGGRAQGGVVGLNRRCGMGAVAPAEQETGSTENFPARGTGVPKGVTKPLDELNQRGQPGIT